MSAKKKAGRPLVDEPLILSAKPRTVPVIMRDGDTRLAYSLRQLVSEELDEWWEFVDGQGLTEEDGKVAKSAGRGIQAQFVSRCLRDEQGQKVPLDRIRCEYPASVVSQLFWAAMQLNELDAEAMERAKNGYKVRRTSGPE